MLLWHYLLGIFRQLLGSEPINIERWKFNWWCTITIQEKSRSFRSICLFWVAQIRGFPAGAPPRLIRVKWTHTLRILKNTKLLRLTNFSEYVTSFNLINLCNNRLEMSPNLSEDKISLLVLSKIGKHLVQNVGIILKKKGRRKYTLWWKLIM